MARRFSNVHIVTAHPERRSFNFAMRERAVTVLTARGLDVKVSDLVQDGFNVVAGRGDFVSFDPASVLQLGKAQREAAAHDGFAPDIVTEQEKLRWCDVVVLQFPLWWGTYPAPMKGWIERVLASGFAYGRSATLPPRAVMYAVTTGGAEDKAEDDAIRARIAGMAGDVFGYMSWEILPPFLAHGPSTMDDAARDALLHSFADHVSREIVSRLP